jgi:putative ABC transport system permease protein
MRLHTLLYFYGRRLRTHPVQELLAGFGIAVGVALAFAVLVANGSVVASAEEVLRGVTGSANLQVAARDGRGFDAGLLPAVRRLPGVARAAPLLEQRAVLRGPNGKQVSVTLGSLEPSLAQLSGALTRSFAPGGFKLAGGLMLPKATGVALGFPGSAPEGVAQPLPRVAVVVRGRAYRMTVTALLGRDTIGSLTQARIAITPLAELQRMTGMQGRVTRILLEARPGQEAAVRRELEILTQGRLAVTSADMDIRLLDQATGPSNQVTGFFAAVSALLGFLLAFNAMLLTAPERRRLVSALRIQGYLRRQIILLVLFQAVLLGLVASAIGVLAGSVLSREVFNESPEYLSSGFTLGTRTIIGHLPLVLALLGGVAASCLAAATPLLDLRRGRAVDAILHHQGAPGNAVAKATRQRMLAVAAVLVLGATAALAWIPTLALAASAMLALATLLAIPTAFALVLRVIETLATRLPRFSTLTVALLAMRATTLRSLALAATGAVAVFGSVAIGGAREDLLRGIGDYATDYVSTADLWILNPADNQATNDFRAGDVGKRIATTPGVAAVRAYHGGFLDMDGRRAWIIARPPGDADLLPRSQIVDGDVDEATARVRRGGWIGISEKIARDRGVEVGERITLEAPAGRVSYRVAATITNLGWAPGAVILHGADYRRGWGRSNPTALEVDLDPGSSAAEVRPAIERAIGPGSGLQVQTALEHAEQMNASVRQGLRRLGQISLLLLIAAVLAMATAMGAAIWQRRSALAALRIQSFHPRQLWFLLLLEASAVLGAGGLTGALGGLFGQLGADRYLAVVTGFPVAPVPAGWQTIKTFVLVVSTAVLIVAIPGWFASRVSPRLGLGSE